MKTFSIEDEDSHDSFRRADKINLFSERGLCWLELPDEPWHIMYYFSSRGHDNFHIYLWIIKDVAWMQDWFWVGHIFGGLALVWILFIVVKALRRGEKSQAWIALSQALWLAANFLWMSGELQDCQFPHRESMYDSYDRVAGVVQVTALCMISSYYLIVVPYKRLFYHKKSHPASSTPSYAPTETLSTGFPVLFQTWTDYENAHILFWLGKDCAWNLEVPPMWVFFMVPTLMIGCDFAWKSMWKKRLVIDHAHYLAQLFWVLSNAVWAAVELFFDEDGPLDEPVSLLSWNATARQSGRWYASWVCVMACVPLVSLYVVWFWATATGRIVIPEELSLQNRLMLYESIMPQRDDHKDYALLDGSGSII